MWMFRAGLKFEKIDDVDEADLQVGELLPKQHRCGQRFLRRYIPRGGEDDIRLATLVVPRPVPNADALGAVLNGGIHIEVLKMQLLVGDDYINIVLTPEAVIGYRQEAVHIGRKVNPSDGRALVEDNVQEAGILVRETVVILAPNRGCDQEVQ